MKSKLRQLGEELKSALKHLKVCQGCAFNEESGRLSSNNTEAKMKMSKTPGARWKEAQTGWLRALRRWLEERRVVGSILTVCMRTFKF